VLIYLAHPIDQAQQRHTRSILVQVVAHILEAGRQQGHGFYRPGGAFNLPAPPWDDDLVRAVDLINQQAIFECHGVLAVVAPGIPTLGTVSEIETALLLNRPTCIVTTEELRRSSVQMANWAGRGAQVVFMSPTGHLHNLDIAAVLGSLPDPTKVFSETSILDLVGRPALLVSRTSTNAKVPSRAYRGDAGLDLAVVGEHEIHPGEYKLLPTGVKAAVPDGWFGFVTARSSAWTKWRFDIRTAIIDSGYRGELMVGVHNRGSERRAVMPGTRLAQYVLLPAFMGDVAEVDELPAHERGENGYGSSGE